MPTGNWVNGSARGLMSAILEHPGRLMGMPGGAGEDAGACWGSAAALRATEKKTVVFILRDLRCRWIVDWLTFGKTRCGNEAPK
jgi:hypothetical protein